LKGNKPCGLPQLGKSAGQNFSVFFIFRQFFCHDPEYPSILGQKQPEQQVKTNNNLQGGKK